MWECCNCVHLNTIINTICEACGHKPCSSCTNVSIPDGLNDKESVFYFYLEKFYNNDKIIDPIEKSKLNDITKDFNIKEKRINQIFKLSTAGKNGFSFDEEIKKVEETKKSRSSKSYEKDITTEDDDILAKLHKLKERRDRKKRERKEKSAKPEVEKEHKKKSKKKYIIIMILILSLSGLGYYFLFGPVKGFNDNITILSSSSEIKDIAFYKKKSNEYVVYNTFKKIIVKNIKSKKKEKEYNISARSIDIGSNGMYLFYTYPSVMMNTNTGQIYRKFNTKKNVNKVKILYNDMYVAFVSEIKRRGAVKNNTYIQFYDYKSGRYIKSLVYYGRFICFSSSGRYLITKMKHVRVVWDTWNRRVIRMVKNLYIGDKQYIFYTRFLTLMDDGVTTLLTLRKTGFIYTLGFNSSKVYLYNILHKKNVENFSMNMLPFTFKKITHARITDDNKNVIVVYENKIYIHKINLDLLIKKINRSG